MTHRSHMPQWNESHVPRCVTAAAHVPPASRPSRCRSACCSSHHRYRYCQTFTRSRTTRRGDACVEGVIHASLSQWIAAAERQNGCQRISSSTCIPAMTISVPPRRLHQHKQHTARASRRPLQQAEGRGAAARSGNHDAACGLPGLATPCATRVATFSASYELANRPQ